MSSLNASFARTWRLLGLTKLRKLASVIFVLVALLGGWFAWLFLDRVSVYSTSQDTKIESTKFPLPVQPAVDGVVLDCNLRLSQHVQEGEVLVHLDAQTFVLQRAQAEALLQSETADVASLQTQIEAEKAARTALAGLVATSTQSGRAKVSVSRTIANAKDQEARVVGQLSESQLMSKLDTIRSEGEKATDQAQVAATSAAAKQEVGQAHATLLESDTRIAALEKERLDAENQAAVTRANIAAIDYEIELRNIRAMDAGTLVDVLSCSPGMTVATTERLATLLPDSEMIVVSHFNPKDAVGRVKPGQTVTLRIDNFPWTQFGTVGAVVERIGSEPRNGLVRVESRITQLNPAIPISHGLTGQAEVEIEKISPFHLALRAAGQWLAPTENAPPGATDSSSTNTAAADPNHGS